MTLAGGKPAFTNSHWYWFLSDCSCPLLTESWNVSVPCRPSRRVSPTGKLLPVGVHVIPQPSARATWIPEAFTTLSPPMLTCSE